MKYLRACVSIGTNKIWKGKYEFKEKVSKSESTLIKKVYNIMSPNWNLKTVFIGICKKNEIQATKFLIEKFEQINRKVNSF